MKRHAVLLALAACTNDTELVTPRREDASLPPPVEFEAGVARCGNVACACSNGLDDDNDQLIDGFDPECSSASDDVEGSFATGVHGEAQDKKCQDCFFDDDSGGDCRRARSCALDGTSSSGTGNCRTCEVSASCADSCLPHVPNGCDCYGCCEVWRGGVPVANVLLDDTCSLAHLDDAGRCVRCTPASTCRNPCGACELCLGRGPGDLPASCAAGFTCEGAMTCGSSADCADAHYCQQGCCLLTGI
jgi:hypothetical protein